MDIKALSIFMEVAEQGSFTKAGEKLGYSQPTISFQIKQLENELNAQLFERINHTVALTERGKEVLGYAHQIRKLAEEMEQPLKNREQVGGHIRMAMADSLCNWLLTNDYVHFHALFPEITLTMHAASTEEMFRLLNQNEVDLVYTLDQHFYDKNYVIVSEKKIEAHIVGSPDIFKKGHYTIEELVKLPFILTEKGMSYRRLMDEKLASMSLEVEPLLETGNTSLICYLTEQGMGISYLPDYVTEDSVKAGRLVRLDVPELAIDIWQQLLYHRSKWITPQMQAVMDYLSHKGI